MKVAVISDIHGNIPALEAALDDIARERVDHLVCAGDIPNPLLRSLDAWQRLKRMGIPLLRGNHEDYIVSYHSGDRPEIRESPQFLPIQLVAQHLGPDVARELGQLPFDHVIEAPSSDRGEDLYVCHASPQHNARSYIKGVDSQMAASFEPIRARTIVAGHIHFPWQGQWQGRQLVIGGSIGLPHHGKPEAEYALLTYHRGSGWSADLRLVPYDQAAVLKEYRESSAFAQGGPIAWMLYDELLSCQARLAFFLPKILADPSTRPTTLDAWSKAVEAYLRQIGRWDAIKRTTALF
jgi:predicted phosphodiesterase